MRFASISIALLLAACSAPEETTEDQNALASAHEQVIELESEIAELRTLVNQRDDQIASLTSEMVAGNERACLVDKRRAAYLEQRRVEADDDYREAQRNLEKVVEGIGK